MSSLITRAGKGSPLTNDEMDANLTYLENKSAKANLGFKSERLIVIDGKIKPFSKPKNNISWNWFLTDTVTPILPGEYQNTYLLTNNSYNGREILITYAYDFIPINIEDTITCYDSIAAGVETQRPFSDSSTLSEKSTFNLNKRILSTYSIVDNSFRNIQSNIKDTALSSDSVNKDISLISKSQGIAYDIIQRQFADRTLPQDIAYLSDTITYVLVAGGYGIITELGYVTLTPDSTRDYGFITEASTKTFDYGTLL
jgi:hypothetical protein